MALQGTLAVNGTAIGHWGARRTGAADAMGWTAYEAEVDSHGFHWSGVVHHRFEDGALVLAAAIMSAAAPHLPVSKIPALLLKDA